MINFLEIGLRIKRLREEAKLSAAELAKRLEVDRESIRLYEKGKALTLQKLEKLALALGIPDEQLIFGGQKSAINTGDDQRAALLVAHFYWLTDAEKDELLRTVKAKADGNRIVIKEMSGKLNPPPDEYVGKILNGKKAKR
jgi:transcriptional regulator with XRE-family HTH domain